MDKQKEILRELQFVDFMTCTLRSKVLYCSILLHCVDLASEILFPSTDRLSGLVVRVPGCRSRGPGSIPGATRFSK
jgi:hypothetical protein